jgi:hypothetical protein
MRKTLAGAGLIGTVLLTLLAGAVPASAAAGKGSLFLDGSVVRTVVVSSPVPGGGTDPFYSVSNPAPGQLGIAGVGPGDAGYSGGDWAVNTVTFNPGVTPYLLTSDEAVFAAEAAGDVTVTRTPGDDFRCPVQP